MVEKKNTIKELSYAFAIRIINLGKILQKDKKEFIISKQIIRSGTSVGALVREAHYAESSKDFIHKLAIALKEENETEYWLSLLIDTDYFTKGQMSSILEENISLIKMLTAIIVTKKKNLKK